MPHRPALRRQPRTGAAPAPSFLPGFATLLLAVTVVLAGIAAAPARAHEGHDHGPAAGSTAADAAAAEAARGGLPVLEATGGVVQLVAAADGAGHLILWIDRLADNAPVLDAAVAVGVGDGEPQPAIRRGDGSFLVEAPWTEVPGDHALLVTVTGPETADLVIGTLTVPAPSLGVVDRWADRRGQGAFLMGVAVGGVSGGLLALVAAALLFGGKRPRPAMASLAIAVACAGVAAGAVAHGGADHSHDEPAAPVVGTDTPQRLPDGTLFVPKRTQRLLEVRTGAADPGSVGTARRLAGRIVPDPDFQGYVQASLPGRIEAPDGGLPAVGTRVEAGQVLAHIVPAFDALARGDVRERIADLERQRAVLRQRLDRLTRLDVGALPGEIAAVQVELAGIERQRAALDPTLAQREDLRAPVAGVIARVEAVPGRMIDDRAETVLFEIVDPDRLRVEALDFAAGPGLGSGVGEGAARATALLEAGRDLPLDILGTGPALANGARPWLFRVPPGTAADVPIGTPVRVLVETAATVEGLVLSADSVVPGRDGLPLVWEQVAPQRFAPRSVRVAPVDGQRVVVLAGLEPGARVVAAGAALLTQIR